MAQLLLAGHVAPFAFTKMILYLPWATQGKHLYAQIKTCIASCLYVYLGSDFDVKMFLSWLVIIIDNELKAF